LIQSIGCRSTIVCLYNAYDQSGMWILAGADVGGSFDRPRARIPVEADRRCMDPSAHDFQ
jgi:hypothetical protein